MAGGTNKKIYFWSGLSLILIGLIFLVVSFLDAFGGLQNKIKVIDVPGFHELKFDTQGVYGGVYQHQGKSEFPLTALSKLDVRVLSKETYEEIPVQMSPSIGITERMGVKGSPLFSFVIQTPGAYTLSAVYKGITDGPSLPIYIFPQSAQNVRQTLIVGAFFFIVFVGLGIWLLFRTRKQ